MVCSCMCGIDGYSQSRKGGASCKVRDVVNEGGGGIREAKDSGAADAGGGGRDTAGGGGARRVLRCHVQGSGSILPSRPAACPQ